ncbi:secreted protein containing Serine/threonine protein kinase-related domain protein, partial [gut metagenome]
MKLTDFGMASLASAAGWGGARGGTVGYMAPEQLEGELVDERSDVFSLAVVIYECLSGRSPFAARDAEDSLKLIERGA